ncbi:TPA: hypothetical protein ACOE4S_002779 [Staphylococcus aureus]|nr:hypothetical protein [Staphylococcus aureus]MBB2534445.1 hypothetical protein [Staphylococcus aureus]CAC8081209.1 Uncharacterised protein [Staphylococcus aureus]HDD7598744.1 hypothetical protein [Staphylococcus aureus]HDE0230089.1 hypothetical protein [Staphylococcus aureus]HDE0243780.1 hypothetical protein [Staphylococcus aureus]
MSDKTNKVVNINEFKKTEIEDLLTIEEERRIQELLREFEEENEEQ